MRIYANLTEAVNTGLNVQLTGNFACDIKVQDKNEKSENGGKKEAVAKKLLGIFLQVKI